MGFTKKQVNHVIHAFKNNDFYYYMSIKYVWQNGYDLWSIRKHYLRILHR